ncbi:glycosyltransferase family 39 protein [Methanobacterium alcaliphilum]|uniref:glycosyltransferase family 39 protein n=1 Tax=Methanobacterium alcaliphilum TaxID=392018 RepID=UPI00200AF531|nr:glycosyltransferase family 39 protein [Methanobacterium alcaliphilum]MCK9151285.1 hypothetical protein [Methanobacterium alcaliphilum]
MYREFLDKNKSIIFIIIMYLIAGALLLYYYQYQINDDGIVYITIANRYIQGNWDHVISSTWVPFLSWILIPFLLFAKSNFEKILFTKIACLFIGCFTIWGIYLLSSRFELGESYKTIFTMVMIPMVLQFSLQVTNPDILVATILIFYLYFIFDEKYPQSKNGLMAGFLGGLAYLAKVYAFPFFLVHFTAVNILNFKKNKKNIAKNFLYGLIVFFIISGAWILVISEENDKLTIGSNGGAYLNQYLIGPNATGHPMDHLGLFEPPHNDSYSILEDTSALITKSWSPFNSLEDFKFQLGLIYNNLIELGKILLWISVFSILIILWAIIVAYKKKDRIVITTLLTILIYVSGYLLFLILLRYFAMVYILLALLGVYLLNNLEKYSFKFDFKRLKPLLIIILIFSFCIGPVISINSNLEKQELNKDLHDLSQIINDEYSIQGNLASNDCWRTTHYLSFYLNSRYYGVQPGTDVNQYLLKNNIDYFLVWGDTSQMNLSSYEKVAFFEDTSNQRILFLTGTNLTIYAKK